GPLSRHGGLGAGVGMNASVKRLAALLAKDAAIHGRDILLTMGALVGLSAALWWFGRQPFDVLMSVIFTFNFLLAGFWGDWLISREKTKGTFAWIRSTPVDDRELVLAKVAAVSICVTVLWTATSVLCGAAYWLAGRAHLWVGLLLILLAFAAVSIASRWRFGQKLGQNLPFLLVGLFMAI